MYRNQDLWFTGQQLVRIGLWIIRRPVQPVPTPPTSRRAQMEVGTKGVGEYMKVNPSRNKRRRWLTFIIRLATYRKKLNSLWPNIPTFSFFGRILTHVSKACGSQDSILSDSFTDNVSFSPCQGAHKSVIKESLTCPSKPWNHGQVNRRPVNSYKSTSLHSVGAITLSNRMAQRLVSPAPWKRFNLYGAVQRKRIPPWVGILLTCPSTAAKEMSRAAVRSGTGCWKTWPRVQERPSL